MYSFRRCPYAIRARLAIWASEIKLEVHEVDLKNKPEHMLNISPKGTVPVLQLPGGEVIEESLEIMNWALAQNDPYNWIPVLEKSRNDTGLLVERNDQEFKQYLDKYKYSDRFPEYSQEYYRQKAEQFLMELENRLSERPFLVSDSVSFADMAILPFIRQFAYVDINWFEQSNYVHCLKWLRTLLDSPIFIDVMKKRA